MLTIGIDEAGRGPVIGPMVIAGALVDEKNAEKLKKLGVKDSKMLSPKKREELYNSVMELSEEVHFIKISPNQIDTMREKISLNEIEAVVIAELLRKFKKKADRIVIDLPDPNGKMFINRIRKYVKIEAEVIAEHKADANYIEVSAASIIAKVERDEEIKELNKKHGELGSGYPSDPKTIAFLKKNSEKRFNFIRYSWQTAQNNTKTRKEKQKALTDF